MPRMPRATPGGVVYHVLNRSNAGVRMFRGSHDYELFEHVLEEAHTRVPIRLLAYIVMPDHWHLVLWPRREGELSEFMRWLSVTHTRRWHSQHDSSGTGHLYQGRYRSFPVEPSDCLATLCRYVESNAKRSGLVRKAQDWHWSSLHRREHGDEVAQSLLDPGPVPLPRGWTARVNAPLDVDELAALRRSAQRGTPFGSPEWQVRVAKKLGLEFTMRPRGRPRKTPLEGEYA